MRQIKLKNFNGNVSMGYYNNRINWRRNLHNNLHFFLLIIMQKNIISSPSFFIIIIILYIYISHTPIECTLKNTMLSALIDI
jgi:hypothetical protein